jgi:serine/threonine protein kinase/tetratricopeptide (TPR) repeat protein
MGAILKTLDNSFQRPVAMKVILGQEDPERLERFVEEAKVTGRLEHPNIVPVHEIGIRELGAGSPRPYFTMKLVRGESLESILDKISDGDANSLHRYSLPRLLGIFLKVCDAVAFAHSQGIVHRDLKPENVMVGRFGEVLVMDWGLAKVMLREIPNPKSQTPPKSEVLSERSESKGQISNPNRQDAAEDKKLETPKGLTLEGEVMGTPSYMPPEQADGRIAEIDERSDIFALGGILYSILAQDAPHTGETVMNIMVKAVEGKVVSPRKRSPHLSIPVELESICMKAMAAKKSKRYASVQSLIEDIRAYQDHRLVSAHRYGVFAKFLRFIQRHPGGSLAGGVALLLVSIGLGITISLTAWAREQKARAETESLRAEKAERETKTAVKRAEVAEDALQKGRQVSAVLRSADVELGRTLEELKIEFRRGSSMEKKREKAESAWPKVAAFEKTVSDRPAAQAAWLSAKGWLRYYGGYEEEAFALFKKAREADADVAYGWLFEGMVWLSKYLLEQTLPGVTTGPYGLQFEEMPPETPGMRDARARFEKTILRVGKARVWGESAAAEFTEVLEGLRGMKEGNLEKAEAGFSRALRIPEMMWIKSEILFARTRIRYLRKDFDGGLEDVSRLIECRPGNVVPLFWKGCILFGKALQEEGSDKDARGLYRMAIEAYEKALRINPDWGAVYASRSFVYWRLGEAEAERGVDPRALYGKAIADCTRALQESGEPFTIHNNRGLVYQALGDAEKERGIDPRPSYRKALTNLNEAVRLNPDFALAYKNRGAVFVSLGEAQSDRGNDPRESFLKAIEDFSASLEKDPKNARNYSARGNAWASLGRAQLKRGMDARETFRKAFEDFSESLKIDPKNGTVYNLRGTATYHFGQVEEMMGADPLPSYRKAVKDFGTALRLKPEFHRAYNNRACAYIFIGNEERGKGRDPRPSYQKAISDFSEVLKRNPESVYAYNNRANVYMHTGRYEAAHGMDPREAYRKAVSDLGEALKRNKATKPSGSIPATGRLRWGKA